MRRFSRSVSIFVAMAPATLVGCGQNSEARPEDRLELHAVAAYPIPDSIVVTSVHLLGKNIYLLSRTQGFVVLLDSSGAFRFLVSDPKFEPVGIKLIQGNLLEIVDAGREGLLTIDTSGRILGSSPMREVPGTLKRAIACGSSCWIYIGAIDSLRTVYVEDNVSRRKIASITVAGIADGLGVFVTPKEFALVHRNPHEGVALFDRITLTTQERVPLMDAALDLVRSDSGALWIAGDPVQLGEMIGQTLIDARSDRRIHILLDSTWHTLRYSTAGSSLIFLASQNELAPFSWTRS